MPESLKETSQGGLAKTASGQRIAEGYLKIEVLGVMDTPNAFIMFF